MSDHDKATRVTVTTTTVSDVRLTDVEIRAALAEYAAREHGIAGQSVVVTITPDSSWEAEGKDLYTARVVGQKVTP